MAKIEVKYKEGQHRHILSANHNPTQKLIGSDVKEIHFKYMVYSHIHDEGPLGSGTDEVDCNRPEERIG